MGLIDWLFGRLDKRKEEADRDVLEDLILDCHSTLTYQRKYNNEPYCMLMGDGIDCEYRSVEPTTLSRSVSLYPCMRYYGKK